MEAPDKDKQAQVDPDEMTFGDCKVVDTKRKITTKPHDPNDAERRDCLGALEQLPKKWDLMFRDKGRIDGPDGYVRLDQQSFTEDGFSNTALQNNTKQGARSQSGCISSVQISQDCEKDGAHVAQALVWAHRRSMGTRTMAVVTYTKQRAAQQNGGSKQVQVRCVSCIQTKMVPEDLVERGLVLGSYPPQFVCGQCQKREMAKEAKQNQ
ncbi:MAG TPA: hypothetical protein VFA65_10735 [Bryobacteraceae bacterium]|nr:hypothetical protein [Bryobacteraceae bacterium]